jgi:hypothetical protein
MNSVRKALKWCFLLILVCGFIEGASLLGLFIIKDRMAGLTYDMVLADKLTERHRRTLARVLSGGDVHLSNDPEIGWTTSPQGGFSERGSNPERKVRIAAFGDSYTRLLGARIPEAGNSRFETVNFGVGGYGLDQTYLRYLEIAPTIDVDVVLIGFMTENANRNLNVFRPFYYPIGGIPFSKPHFKLVDGELRLMKNPLTGLSEYRELLDNTGETLRKVGADDHYFSHRPESGVFDFSSTVRLARLVTWGIVHKQLISEYIKDGVYDEQTQAYRITLRIFEKHYNEVLNNGSTPFVVLFPRKVDVSRHRAEGKRVYQPLIDYFDEKEYRFIDLLDAFNQEGVAEQAVEDLFMSDGAHYNDKGNTIARGYLYHYLSEHYPERAGPNSE